MAPPPTLVPSYYQRPPSRGWAIALTILVGLWIVATTTLTHGVTWFVGEILLELERTLPPWVWVGVGWLVAVLGAVPAILLGRLSKVDWARAAGRGWALAAVAGAALGTARLVPVAFHEWYLALLAVLGLLAAAVGRFWPGGASSPGAPLWSELVALAGGLACLVPWLWVGALGGALESVLAVAAALAVGLVAARVLTPLVHVAHRVRNRWGSAVLGGLVAGVAITAMAAGVGEPGVQLAALIALPALGFTGAALDQVGRPALVPLIGVAAIGPLAFVDPEETSLILGIDDAGFWTLVAAAGTFAVALLVFVGYVETVGRGIRFHRWLAGLVAGAVATVAAVVYIGPGQPGLYGEHVFVVLKTQADLTGLDAIADRAERLRQTYRRLVDSAERSQASIRRDLRGMGLGFTPYYLVNGLEVDAGPIVRTWLAGRSDVDRILLNPKLRPLPRPPALMHGDQQVPASPQWNVTVLGADRVWRDLGVTGQGIVVGSSDSGVDGTHPAVRDRYRGGDDSWLDPWDGTVTPTDHNGHGTHTLATAVGDKVGVAPGATWTGCVNLARNLGNPGAYLTCLQFMLAPYPHGGNPLRDGRPERAPQVLTNSWGCTTLEGCDRDSLRQATAALTAAGIYVVVAAGNTGPYCRSLADPPAIYPDALTVGAIDRRNQVTLFSSRGPAPSGVDKPDVVAPGEGILSALPGGGYGRLDGTSMAAPHVAGVVALMWSANPKLVGDIPRTTRILRQTATPVQPTYLSRSPSDTCGSPVNIAGAGRVDAFAAVTAARAAS